MKKRLLLLTMLVAAVLFGGIIALSTPNGSHEKEKTIVLTKDNTLVLNDEVSTESVGFLITSAQKLDQKSFFGTKKPIYLFLRTPGGSIQDGLELIDGLNSLNRKVHTVTMFAASMGFQTVQGLGNRYMVKNGVLMSHRAFGGFTGSFGGQKPSQMDSRKNFWEQRILELDQQTVERTKGKQTLESYQKAYRDELWLTSSQAVEQGYADELVKVQCDLSLNGLVHHSLSVMMIRISYDLSECPLDTMPKNIVISFGTNKGTKTLDEFVKEGGEFGSTCLVSSGISSKLCATDTSLTLEKLKEMKTNFAKYYFDIENRIIPMRF